MKEKTKEEELISDLHKLIEEKKDIERISWDNLGRAIGYSGVGVKKALKNKSLSLIKIEKIIIKLGLVKEAESLGFKISNEESITKVDDLLKLSLKGNILKNEKDLDQLESLALSNWKSLIKRQSFIDKVEKTFMKDANKILDARLADILKQLNLTEKKDE